MDKDGNTIVDDVEHIIVKYTRLRISWQDLVTAGNNAEDPLRRILPNVMTQAAYAISGTETSMAQVIGQLTSSLQRVTDNLTAGPEDQVYAVTANGELQGRGVLLDALIARRDAQIQHLQTLVVLWNAATTGVATLPPAPPPAGNPTTGGTT